MDYVKAGTTWKNNIQFRGDSLIPLINGGKWQRSNCFSELVDMEYRNDVMRCVRNMNYKLIATLEKTARGVTATLYQLFDLRQGERECDIKDEKYISIFTKLKDQLLQWEKSLNKIQSVPVKSLEATQLDTETNEKLKKRLKSLGYTQ